VSTRANAERWLEAYVAAWKSYDADAIRALFTEDCVYRYRPVGDEIRGRETVVKSWLEDEPHEAGTYDAEYGVYAVDGDRAVAIGATTYRHRDGSLRDVFDNCFLLRFDAEGRCREFTEWFMERPTPK
jgi:ketosteroid isomerase-like protein